jgi:hypothetical protein
MGLRSAWKYGASMPTIDLTSPRGALTEDARRKLMAELAEVADAVEVREALAYVDGRRYEQAGFQLVVSVCRGALDDARKRLLEAEVAARVLVALGFDSASNHGLVTAVVDETL